MNEKAVKKTGPHRWKNEHRVITKQPNGLYWLCQDGVVRGEFYTLRAAVAEPYFDQSDLRQPQETS